MTDAMKNYEAIGYDDLLLYAIWSLQQEDQKLLWENIVIKAFELFPKRFGLPRHEDIYPDSSQIDRSLLRCRDKRFITGMRSQGYRISNLGLSMIDSIQKKLGQETKEKKDMVGANKKSKSGRLITHIKRSTAFKKFSDSKLDSITDYEVNSLLLCPLDASNDTKTRQLNQLKDEIRATGDEGLVEFLNFIEKKYISPPMVNKKRKGMFG